VVIEQRDISSWRQEYNVLLAKGSGVEPFIDVAAVDLPALLADLESLVRCESPSADLAAVSRSADLVARIGTERLGFPPERLLIDGCSHLRWRFGAGPRRVLLLAHHDTVWPLGSLERHPWSNKAGVVTGPGCFDMKAGLVMTWHALASLSSTDPASGAQSSPALDGVTLLVTGDEEVGSTTSRGLIENEARGCAAVFVLEASGPGGAVKTSRKGVSRYRLQITGRAAHDPRQPGPAQHAPAGRRTGLAAHGRPGPGGRVGGPAAAVRAQRYKSPRATRLSSSVRECTCSFS